MMGKSRKSGRGIGEVGSKRSGKKRFERVERIFADEKREEAGTAAHAGLEKAFDAISDWVCLMDTKSHILRSNSAGERFTGLGTEEMVGQLCCKLVHGSDKPLAGCPLKKMLKTGRRGTEELKVSGEDRWLAVTVDPLTDEQGGISGAVHIVRDITEEKRAKELLQNRVEFERIITNISSSFVNVEVSEVDSAIEKGLEDIGRFCGVDRAYVFLFSEDGKKISNTHEWCVEGIECQAERLKNIVFDEELPWVAERIRGLRTLLVPSVAELPSEAMLEKEHFEMQDIKSLIVVPMVLEKVPVGFLGFDAVRMTKEWPEDDITLLRVAGEVFINAMERKRAQEELEQERNLLRTLIDNMPDEIYVKDTDSRFILCNRTVAEHHGVSSPDELIGKTDFDLYPGEVAERYCAEEQQIMCSGEPKVNCFEIYLDSKGNEVWGLNTRMPLRDSEGKIIGIVGIGRDVAQEKKAEKALIEERNLLRTVIENIPNEIYVKDTGSRFVLCNKAVVRHEGQSSADDVVGKTDFDFYPRDLAEQFLAEERRVIESGEPLINREGVNRDAADEEFCVLTTKVPLRDSEGRITGIVGICHDITERKAMEEALAKEHNLLRTLIDSIPDEIYVKDAESRFVMCNKAVARHRGVQSFEELAGKTDFDLYPEDEATRCYTLEQEIIRSGESVANRKEYGVDAEGNEICGLTTKMPLRDSSGGIVGLLGISRNITEEEKAEQKLIEYQRQLKSLASQLTLAEERERRRIAGELHDTVSQSLALAKIKLDALRAGATARGPNEVLAEVSESLDKTIQDTRSLTFDLSYPILYELGFETAVEEWLEENVGRRYGIKTRFYDDGSEKLLDDDVRVLLFRNVRELLTNVVKHSNAKKVKVSVQKLGGEIQVCVKDDGVGFDVEQTVATAARRSEYGLMSIRERLEDIGGNFDIKSSPGGGCTATMTVPVNNEQIEAGG